MTTTHTAPPIIENHCHEQLLMGWEHVSKMVRQRQRRHQAKWNDNAMGKRNNGGTKGKQGGWGGARQTKKKAQETSNDVSWAISMFFSFLISLFYC